MATTSGTVSATPFTLRKVIDHACRRAGFSAQDISAEELTIATDLVFLLTSQWINAGFPLWTRQYHGLAITQGSADVQTPTGTVEIIHAYWRILNPYRGAASLSSGGDGSILFGGAPNADVTISGPNPGVSVAFGSSTFIDTLGILPGGSVSVTGTPQVWTSSDGVTYALFETLASTTFVPGVWSYFCLNPTVSASYVKVLLPQTGAWTLNQMNLGLGNSQDILIGPLNIDDYYNQPNRSFETGQPNSAFQDRPLTTPVLKIWPTPNAQAFYNGTVTALTRRYIQDPGALTNNVEVPQKWLEALIWRLAKLIMYEFPEKKQGGDGTPNMFTAQLRQQRSTDIETEATKAEGLAWSDNRDKTPLKIMPNLRAYTA